MWREERKTKREAVVLVCRPGASDACSEYEEVWNDACTNLE